MKKVLALGCALCLATSAAIAAPAKNVKKARAEKEWTMMVFLNGDNNLDKFGTADMNEMAKAGSSDNVNVVVLRDTANKNNSSKMYYIEKDNQKLIHDFKTNIDMGDYHNLVSFFKFVKENYPAKKFIVDIWNHGAGWKKKLPDPLTKGISYDDNSGNHITTKQLGLAFNEMKAINDGKKIDVLGMDACLMQMAEVAYEVKDTVKAIEGSEETEPGDGWYYTSILEGLNANPQMNAIEVANLIAKTYAESYSGGAQGNQVIQSSAVIPENLVSAAIKFNEYVDYLMKIRKGNNSLIQSVMAKTQSYAYRDYKDIIHFMMLLKSEIKDETLAKLTDQTIVEISKAIYKNYVNGQKLGNSHGLSVWIPTEAEYTPKRNEYKDLNWTRETNWDEFIEAVIYPSEPLISIGNTAIQDENNDSFITAGEVVNFAAKINNKSPIAGKNVTAKIIAKFRLKTGGFKKVKVSRDVQVGELPIGDTIIKGLSVKIADSAVPGSYVYLLSVSGDNFAAIEKEIPIVVDPAYKVENYALSSPHEYTNNFEQVYEIKKPGAKAMRVHFSKFSVEKSYDKVIILDANDKEIAKYDGDLAPFWTATVLGDVIKIKLKTDSMVTKYGFDVDKIAY